MNVGQLGATKTHVLLVNGIISVSLIEKSWKVFKRVFAGFQIV